MEIITTVLASLALMCMVMLAVTWWRRNTGVRAEKEPPSLPSVPILGSLPFFPKFKNPHDLMTKLAEKYGKVFSFYAGNELTVIISDFMIYREAMIKCSSHLARRKALFADKYYLNPEYRGIFAKYGQEFKDRHNIIMGIFKKFGYGDRNIMEERIQTEISHLVKFIESKNGISFNPAEILQMTSLNVIFNFMFGERFELGDKKLNVIYSINEAITKGFNPVLALFPLLSKLPMYKSLLEELTRARSNYKTLYGDMINRCRESAACADTFVGEYIENFGDNYDEQDLTIDLKDFFMAGTETTSTLMSWTVIFMANYPNVQKKCQQEIDAVVPRNRLPSHEDKPKLPYIEAMALEMMRLRPVVPVSPPRISTSKIQFAGYEIPKDSAVMGNILSMHMNPTVWSEPEKFNPERFLDQDGKITNADQLFVFGLGRRSCPGETLARSEMFLVVAALLQNFNILPPEGEANIRDEMNIVMLATPHPYRARFVTRHVTMK